MPSKKHAERMPHVTFGAHKKQCFGPVPKHPNAKHKQGRGVLAMASQRLVSLRSEKTETPAGSRPEEREFLHQKGCQERGFRTIAAQIFVSLRSEKTETPARFEPMPSKKHAERMPHVTFGTHKKQSFGSETTKRQQESSPCQAKNTPKECLTWPLEPILKTMLWSGSKTPER